MLKCEAFLDALTECDVDFFTGVPDSLLKYFCAYVTDHAKHHIITANEGAAVALAAGYHLATGKFPLVYMQNSGQGNAVNPLTSLADKEVYGVPMLLLIGWRGEPGKKDEPQHVKQGRIMCDLLDCMEIPYDVLPEDDEGAKKAIAKAVETMKETSAPYAIIVRKGTFESYELKNKIETSFPLSREDAIKTIVDNLGEQDIVVSTTGKTSRELFEYREEKNQGHEKDFLTVGSMGHSNHIALGIALARPDRNVFCLDGDGAAIMHLGSLAVIGQHAKDNYKHIVINNGAHDSVGGQPTVGFDVSFQDIAKACGYTAVLKAETKEDIASAVQEMRRIPGPAFLEIRVNKGARKDLGRPTTTPHENKDAFQRFVR